MIGFLKRASLRVMGGPQARALDEHEADEPQHDEGEDANGKFHTISLQQSNNGLTH